MNEEHESTVPADSSVLDDLRKLAAEARADSEGAEAQPTDTGRQPPQGSTPETPAPNQGSLDALAQLAGQGRATSSGRQPPLMEESGGSEQPSSPPLEPPSLPAVLQAQETAVLDLTDLAPPPRVGLQATVSDPQQLERPTVAQPVPQQSSIDQPTQLQPATTEAYARPTRPQPNHGQHNGAQANAVQHDARFEGLRVEHPQPNVQPEPLRAPQPASNWTPPARMVMPSEPERSSRSSSRPWRFLVALLTLVIVALVAVVIYLASLQLLGSGDSEQPADGESVEVDGSGGGDGQ